MPKTPPNILIFFTDMQRADTIAALGNPIIKTPSLDRLVREGAAFVNAFTPSPVCVPARHCLQYGTNAATTGMTCNRGMPDHNGRAYPDVLRTRGYHSASIGKCHFTKDAFAKRGFDERLIQEEIAKDGDDYRIYLREKGLSPHEPHGMRSEMYYIPQISHLSVEDHPTQWIGDRTLDFLDARRESDQPWCLFSSFIHPHPPLALPRPWHKLYRASDMPFPEVPENAAGHMTAVNRIQNRYKYRDAGVDKRLMQTLKAYYYAAISFIDFQIGRILERLEEHAQLDDTLLVFTSDHGEYLGDFNCFGKRGMHDPSARIPLIVRHPNSFDPDSRPATPVSLIDVAPTLFKAAGIDDVPADYEGLPLQDLASGAADRQEVVSIHGSHEYNYIYMVVNREWKYFFSVSDDKEYLYDRKNDPLEHVNRAEFPELDAVKDDLKGKLLRHLRERTMGQAYVETSDGLDWRRFDKKDLPSDARGYDVAADPDEGLLRQDEKDYDTRIPGYTDQ